MSETEQTLEANSSMGVDEGQQDANVEAADITQAAPTDANKQEETLAFLNKVSKRDFKSITDAEKYLEGLQKLVGDNQIAKQRKAAELAQTLIQRVANENGMTYEQAENYLKNLTNNMEQQAQSQSGVHASDPQIEDRLRRGERAEFLLTHPEAKPFIDKLEDYSRATGQSYSESFEKLFADIVKREHEQSQIAEAEAQKKEAQVMASTNTGPEKMPDQYNKLMSEYRKTGKQDFLLEAVKIKNKRLGIG